LDSLGPISTPDAIKRRFNGVSLIHDLWTWISCGLISSYTAELVAFRELIILDKYFEAEDIVNEFAFLN
jgi:hypothetical protein